jgi:hypothetical protein
MSINSKARRDARRKQQSGRTTTQRRAAPVPAHAHLLGPDDRIVGGIGLRGDEWALVLGGQVVTTTDSAAMAIAMLNRAAAATGSPDAPLRLRFSDALRDAATREADARGQSLDQLIAALEAERIEHVQKKQTQSPGSMH